MEKNNKYRETMIYQFRVEGLISSKWSEWFEGLSLSSGGHNQTLITGAIDDQAALYGILRKLRDLGIPLISLFPVNKKGEKL